MPEGQVRTFPHRPAAYPAATLGAANGL